MSTQAPNYDKIVSNLQEKPHVDTVKQINEKTIKYVIDTTEGARYKAPKRENWYVDSIMRAAGSKVSVWLVYVV